MKLLFYNWDRIDGWVGGGVTIYQRNLVKYLLQNKQYEIFFLNSGLKYTINSGNKLELLKIPNNISDSIKTFEIMNSPIIAPVRQSIINFRYYLEDFKVYEILKKFIEQNGGFDVIHFNNLEGLSINVLKLKEDFPNTKFIFSLHNYFLICGQVYLWQSKNTIEGHNCNKKNYEECFHCYNKSNYNAEIFSRRYLEKLKGIKGFRRVLTKMYPHLLADITETYSDIFPDVDDIDLYRQFEENNILYANKYFDAILAVSNRVKEIFVSRGLDEKKVYVSYIGTDVAEIQQNTNCADINENPFRIIFMSYMTAEKGFYFFLESLQKMANDLAKNIVAMVVAKYDNKNSKEVNQLLELKKKFKDVILKNGYSRDEQKQILQGQHLGIVPVMWEDNLPQIAIEQIAYGVPILCSNLGGVSELHSHNLDFTFEAGNINDFLQKFENIINNRNLLQTYWNSVKKLTTMQEHVKFLEQIYRY